jgi:hypothetical protein
MANRPEGVMNRVPYGQVKNRPLMFAYLFLSCPKGTHFVTLRYASGKPFWFTISVLLALRDAYDQESVFTAAG